MKSSDLDDRGAIADLVAVANTGLNSRRIVQCNENTLNTPYKAGLTAGKSGTAYINMSSIDYGTILYIVSGTNRMFLRSKDNGNWNDWNELLKNSDLKAQSGLVVVASKQNEPVEFNVTFAEVFTSVPQVTAAVSTSLPHLHSVSISAVTKTGFKGYLYRSAAAENINVRWIAVGT